MDQTEEQKVAQLRVNAAIAELVQQRDMALNRCVEMRVLRETEAAAAKAQIEALTAKVKELEVPKPKKPKVEKPKEV